MEAKTFDGVELQLVVVEALQELLLGGVQVWEEEIVPGVIVAITTGRETTARGRACPRDSPLTISGSIQGTSDLSR